MSSNLSTDGNASSDHPLPLHITEQSTAPHNLQQAEELQRIRQWAVERQAVDLLSAQALSAHLKNLGHSNPKSLGELSHQVSAQENQTRAGGRNKSVDYLRSLRPAERESEILHILSNGSSSRDELVACVDALLESGEWLYPWKLAQYRWQFLYLKKIAWVTMNTAIEDVSFAGVTVGAIMNVSGFRTEEDILTYLNTWVDWPHMI